jgi:formate dehydrogenase maturation protein FdhE
MTMDVDEAAVAPSIDHQCPRCSARGGTMTLLTSMTRYYMCEQCNCRWHVLRRREGWLDT